MLRFLLWAGLNAITAYFIYSFARTHSFIDAFYLYPAPRK